MAEIILDKESRDLIEKMGKSYQQVIDHQETFKKELKEMREDPLLKDVRDKWATEFAKLHETITNMKQVQETLETKLARPELQFTDKEALEQDAKMRKDSTVFNMWKKGRNHSNGQLDEAGFKEYCKQWEKFIRVGDKAMDSNEYKALSVGQDPDGGLLTRPQWSARIVQRIFETSPMRAISTVETISSAELKIPTDPNEAACGWVGEQAARNETATPQIAEKSIVAQEMYALAKATQSILEDAAIDVETWLSNKLADKFARTEATAFVSGTGVSMPRGFLTYAAAVDSANDGNNAWGTLGVVKTTSSGAFTVTGLTKGVGALKDAYHPRARWLIKRESVPLIMLLQDGAGRYIFQPIFSAGFNEIPLLGYPINYAFDMPSAASGSYSAAFGDFAAGYTIVDRVGVTVLRDPYLYKPFIGFYTRKRVGGDVVDFDAIKIIQLSA